jgi:hypothetical protein
MRLTASIFALAAVIAGGDVWAHGPQIQTTLEGGKVVTRRLLGDGPYSTSLMAPTLAYVMPLAENAGIWYSRPNGSLLPGGIPEFNSGPGLAYGYGYDAATNPAPFPLGAQFILGFAAGLKSWNGAAFVDAGATQLEAFRGSGVNLVVARSSDAGPHADIKFPSVMSPGAGISFAGDGDEVHTSVSYRMLGDGSSTTSALADGIYLATLQLGLFAEGVTTSDPFYFVLTKNAANNQILAAVSSLGLGRGQIQYAPEPTAAGLLAIGLAGIAGVRRRNGAGG